jgi:hypothetical protein
MGMMGVWLVKEGLIENDEHPYPKDVPLALLLPLLQYQAGGYPFRLVRLSVHWRCRKVRLILIQVPSFDQILEVIRIWPVGQIL